MSGELPNNIIDLLSEEELRAMYEDLAEMARDRRRAEAEAATWPMH